MTYDIYISYNKNDGVEAAKIAKALETEGFTVNWDQSLLTAENSRERRRPKLDASSCVITLLTRKSVEIDNNSIQDKVSKALVQERLIPVMMQKVRIPDKFSKTQYVDLIGWRGSTNNPFFQDLANTVRAKLGGTIAPEPRGPIVRLRRRLYASLISATFIGGIAAFGANVLSIQENICSVSFVQPELSDRCGALGLGGKPTKEERLAWSNIQSGNCEMLRQHIRNFPTGVFRDNAADLIIGAAVEEKELWKDIIQPLAMYVSTDAESLPDLNSAKADAMTPARAGFEAERVCQSFASSQSYKYLSARYEVDRWNCNNFNGGIICGFDGKALCKIKERSTLRTTTCGGIK